MDHATLLAHFLDDEVLLNEMVARLLARLPSELDAMRSASADGDVAAVHEVAHSLKGSLGLFGPSAVYDVVCRLELVSRNGDPDAAALELNALEGSAGHMMAELRRLVPGALDPT
ncbi:MAG: Hpt domain-containing protein [Acidobacteria bacterium]|nr:Hpt domain-containing protein [Acidobacteriota bacterium]